MIIPEDNYNRGKLFFDLIPYYEINNTNIKYKNKIFYNNEELKIFFNSFNHQNNQFKPILTNKHSKTLLNN